MRRIDTSPYDAKIKELHGLVVAEAQKLQKATEAKENVLREIHELIIRKTNLCQQLNKLTNDIQAAQGNLEQTIKRENTFVDSVKKELQSEQFKTKAASITLGEITDSINQLLPVVKELREFVIKESDTRLKYLTERRKLEIVKLEKNKIDADIIAEKEKLIDKGKSLDAMKTYLVELYGKVASYTKSAKETLEYVNEELEKKDVPLRFDVPPGEIVTITIDDFNKQLQ